MTMTTKTKKSTVVWGTLSCALITAVLAAFDGWIFTYTDPRSGFLGSYSAWAPIVAAVTGVGGFLAGALLGVFLSLRPRGLLFGTLAGTIEGLAIAAFLLARMSIDTEEPREALMIAAFVPIGAISGLWTSLIISARTSSQPRRTGYVLLDPQQNRADESRR
jgi:hypothetical protein